MSGSRRVFIDSMSFCLCFLVLGSDFRKSGPLRRSAWCSSSTSRSVYSPITTVLMFVAHETAVLTMRVSASLCACRTWQPSLCSNQLLNELRFIVGLARKYSFLALQTISRLNLMVGPTTSHDRGRWAALLVDGPSLYVVAVKDNSRLSVPGTFFERTQYRFSLLLQMRHSFCREFYAIENHHQERIQDRWSHQQCPIQTPGMLLMQERQSILPCRLLAANLMDQTELLEDSWVHTQTLKACKTKR